MNELPSPPTSSPLVIVRGVAGALIGGVVGYFVFQFLLNRGLYGVVLPEAMVGIGCAVAVQNGIRRSVLMAITCFFIALVTGVLAEWQGAPFVDDDSLSFFVQNLHQSRNGVSLMAILGGSAIAAYFGYRG